MRFVYNIFLFTFIFSCVALAETHLLFVAGHGSSPQQLSTYSELLKAKIPLNDFKISVYPLPSLRFEKEAVLRDSQTFIRLTINSLNQMTANDTVVLVGHSSGSAVVTAIAQKIRTSAKIFLVILDGFFPQGVPGYVQTTCWSSRSENISKMKSINWPGMSRCSNFNEIVIKDCDNSMCLHFSLVNKSELRSRINPTNYDQMGYKDVVPSLIWWPLSKSLD